MIKAKSKMAGLLLATVFVLSACGDSEAEELERQQQIEKEANDKAVEMLEKYKEEAKEKRVSPYTISEMTEGFGEVYKGVRNKINGFNEDIMGLRDDEVTVYDINKKISDYRIELGKYDDVDTLKIPDDYYSFYTGFKEVATDYVNNLESFGNYYQSKDSAGIEEVSVLISENLTRLYNLEFGIFGTPLGDEILSGNAKERSDKRLKELCTQSVAVDNSEYLESIALPEVDKSQMDEEELLERKEAEEEYVELMKQYREDSKSDEEKCYSDVMAERATFGNRVVESESADLEAELMEMLDSYEQRQAEQEELESTEGETEESFEEGFEGELEEELTEEPVEVEESEE